jgi:cardiolipin synthase
MPPRTVPINAVWTVPNAISMVRIILIVVFVFLLINNHDAWAVGALVVAGISDFLDGFLARRWNQITTLGRLLDPAADRLLTIAVVVAFAVRGIVPWWLLAILLVRDVVVALALIIGKLRGVATPEVTFLGKAATLVLYIILPLAYLAYERWDALHTTAIAAALVASVMYWGAGIGYVRDVSRRMRA